MATYSMTVNLDIPDDFGTFQALESNILEFSRQAGRDLLKQILSDYDEFKIKKIKRVQKKDQRLKKLGTKLGAIEYQRWRVYDVGQKKVRYLSDEWLGLQPYQKVTLGLKKEIIKQCVHLPFKRSTQIINKHFGIKRAVMSNWKLIQNEGSYLKKKLESQNRKTIDWKQQSLPQLKDNVEDPCPILAIDPDATYVRSRRKTDKKHEVKLAVLYTHKNKKGKNRWVLENKQTVLSSVDESADAFFNKVTDVAVRDFGLHASSRVICHGDGDPWIKRLQNDYCPQALNRLDPYHVFEKIKQKVGIKEIPKDWKQDFYKNPTALINKITNFKKQFVEDEEKTKIEELIQYFKNNKEGMEPSKLPKRIKKKYPRMYLRGSGSIESNIFQGICHRFKGPRMMWSKDGLGNLSYLRQRELNKSFNFKKPKIKKEDYRTIDYESELRSVVKDLGQEGYPYYNLGRLKYYGER